VAVAVVDLALHQVAVVAVVAVAMPKEPLL
jgi:hypothetical protein